MSGKFGLKSSSLIGPGTAGLSPEQLLAVADLHCSHTGARVRSYAALCAAAAVTTARIAGVPVAKGASRAWQLRDAIVRLEPLSHGNAEFAALAVAVLQQWEQERLAAGSLLAARRIRACWGTCLHDLPSAR